MEEELPRHGEEEGQAEKDDDEGTHPKRQVRLLTQNMNIHHFVGHAYHNREARVRGLLERVEGYDVVMLQELFKFHLPWGTTGVWRDRIIAKWPHHHQASHAPPSWFQQDTGLLILSKHPIIESKTIFFKERSYTEAVSLKGALMVKLQIGEEEEDTLIVVTAHLDAHSFDVRQSQLAQLMDEIVLKELEANPEARILLGGDLNIDSKRNRRAWEAATKVLRPLKYAIEKGSYQQFDEELGEERTVTIPYTHDIYREVCVDHIFYHGVEVIPDSLQLEIWPAKPASTSSSGRQELISDHYGISGIFAW